jgi:hypothetical protein
MLGISRSHEVKERVKGREPDITGGDPILSIVFQIGQKRQNSGGIQINQVEHRNGLLSLLGNKAEQQNDAVAITMDGVGTRSSEAGQVIGKVVTNNGAEQIGRLFLHRRPPFPV